MTKPPPPLAAAADEPRCAVHVVPLGDLREHEPSVRCWCRPAEEFDEPDVWVHRALDGRERYERGELRLQ